MNKQYKKMGNIGLIALTVVLSGILSVNLSPKVAEAQVANPTISNFVVDKASYVWGETVTISFNSSAAASLAIKLAQPTKRFVTNITSSTNVKAGSNVFKYNIPALGFNSNSNLYRITLNNLASGKIISMTNDFEIATSTLSVAQTASSSTLVSPKEAEFTRDFTVKANTGTVYLYAPETFSIKLSASVRTAVPTVINKVVTNIDTGEVLDGEIEIPQGETLNLRLITNVVSHNNNANVMQKVSGIYYHLVEGTEDELWINGFQNINPLNQRVEKF